MALKPFELPDTPFNRMRLLATLLLAAMAGVFAAASAGQGTFPWLGYVRAFAEASLVGGLADWFAVTALFRRPLGLPIPHTAIVPVNKDRIGDSLALFLKDNFLTPAVMARRMERLGVADILARWLTAPPASGTADGGAQPGRLRRVLFALVARLVASLDDTVVAQLLETSVTARLRTLDLAPSAGRFLAGLVADRRHEALVEALVVVALDFLDRHEGEIYAAVAARSGKWVPAWIDDKIAGGIVTAVRARLLAMSDAVTASARRDAEAVMADFRERRAALEAGAGLPAPVGQGREHPDRLAVTAWLTRLAAELQQPGSPAATRFEAGKRDVLDSAGMAALFASAWATIKGALAEHLDARRLDPPRGGETAGERPGGPAEPGRFAAALGAVITGQPALAEAVDAFARRAVVSVVATYGAAVVRLVSDTIRSWDAGTVTDKLEAAVGRDLQYIRINGTVIGGLIGLAIYAAEIALRG